MAVLINNASELASAGLDLLFPRNCEACGRGMDAQPGYLCWECLRTADKAGRPFCEKCGDPVDGKVEGSYVCSWCRKHKPAFEYARSVFRHRGGIRNLVHVLKYGSGFHLADTMGELIAGGVKSFFPAVEFDIITAVPLFTRRERARGYNQAALLADAAGRAVGIDVFNRIIKRVRDTLSQTELNAHERGNNVRNAFQVTHADWAKGRRILLIDDVITTGATVDECARTFMKAGAASVHVVSFARG